MKISQHAKMRIKERVEGVNSIAEAEKLAQHAFRSGIPSSRIEDETLRIRCERMAKSCSRHAMCKIYKDNIFLFKGSKEKTNREISVPERERRAYRGIYQSTARGAARDLQSAQPPHRVYRAAHHIRYV